jgi:hypothetical protein
MRFQKQEKEAFAITVGNLALFFCLGLLALLMSKTEQGLLALVLVAAVGWREHVIRVMRDELDDLRKKGVGSH